MEYKFSIGEQKFQGKLQRGWFEVNGTFAMKTTQTQSSRSVLERNFALMAERERKSTKIFWNSYQWEVYEAQTRILSATAMEQ